jgi:hypothetical protein
MRPGPRLSCRSALLALMLFPPSAAAQAAVPQPRALTEALLRVNLSGEAGDGRLGRGRFPLPFAVTRPHGQFTTRDRSMVMVISGHGPSRRVYRSVSLEMLFTERTHFDADLAAMAEVITTIGLPAEAAAAAVEMLRTARREADIQLDNGWSASNQAHVEETAGLHLRLEGSFHRGGAYATLQLTDAGAPETHWPAPRDVETLLPWDRRIVLGATDIIATAEPEVFDLRCRPAGRGAFHCSYVVTVSDWIGPNAPRERYTDVFRSSNGSWTRQGAQEN